MILLMMNYIYLLYERRSPSSFAGAISAAWMCNLLEIDFLMVPLYKAFSPGWKSNALEPQPAICERNSTVTDCDGVESKFSFHWIIGDTSATIVVDLARYMNKNDITNQLLLCIKNPKYEIPRTFHISISSTGSLPEYIHAQFIKSIWKYDASTLLHQLQHASNHHPIW